MVERWNGMPYTLPLYVPFDDMAKTEADKAWLKSFYPALMLNGTYKGKTYGIPFQRSTIVLYWNKDAFREAGLDPEKAPANWNEMAQMAGKLVKKDASGNVSRWGVMVPSTGYAYWMFQAFARQNGQDLMSRDGNRTNYAHPDVVAALQYWRDLGAKHKVMPEGTVEWGTLRQAFVADTRLVLLLIISERARADGVEHVEPAERLEPGPQITKHESDEAFRLTPLVASRIASVERCNGKAAGDHHARDRRRGNHRQAALPALCIALHEIV